MDDSTHAQVASCWLIGAALLTRPFGLVVGSQWVTLMTGVHCEVQMFGVGEEGGRKEEDRSSRL